ncbi:cilia- and flagella-associated protein 57 [Pycnococcus provasolii]
MASGGAAPLALRHVFGLKGDVADNVHYLDENTVLYPAGHNTVIYHTETRTQKFIAGTPDADGITALALSPNRKFAAVAEKSEKGIITVFDLHTLKRRKVLTSPESGSSTYVSMSFSPDGKLLAALAGAPEYTLVLWVWEKGKVASTAKASNQQGQPVKQVLFNPFDPTIISCVGQNAYRTFRAADSSLKSLPAALSKREPQSYTCHCWLQDDRERCVVSSDTGDILMLEGGELKATLPPAGEGVVVEAMVAFSKGFICAGSGGVVSIYERTEDKENHKRSKSFTIEGMNCKVKSIAISPSEEALVCTLENNQMYVLVLANSDLLKADEMQFELLSQSFHSKGITGMDLCIRKPLVASCSSDRTIRIWNYAERATESVREFAEEAYAVAFHPSGLHILVGFADKLRLMNLLMDDIRPYREFAVKGCRECRFSNGGHLFAAVNGNTVQIYNTYTCENIGNLRGHNGKVRSLHWSPDDTRLVSAGIDGAIYEWSLKDYKRESESVLKGCNYNCVSATADGRNVFAVGSDGKLKELDEFNHQLKSEIDTGGVMYTQVSFPNTGRILFAGTESGTIRTYRHPLTPEYVESQAHSGGITRQCVTQDDSMLVSAGDDGCLYVFDIVDKDGRAGKRDKEGPAYAEEVLVTKSDLEERKARMLELETQVNELTMQNEYQLRLKDLNMNERIKDVTEKFTHELESDKSKFELLLQEKNEMEMEYEEKLRQAEERHHIATQQLEASYQAKFMAEVERYQALAREKDLLNERWDEQNSLLVESHERVIQELTEEYESKLQGETMAYQNLQAEKEETGREFEETKRQLEEDADREIEELKERYELRLVTERDISLRLKGENGIMKKKFSSLSKEIEDGREEIKALFGQKTELYERIASLEKDIAGLRKEIAERDDTIGDKEKRIYDLKRKNQELEKFKFVLDYKIKELKKQIEPRELEIADMRLQIKEMDAELERYHKNNATLDLTISDLRLKLDGLQRELLKQRRVNADSEAVVRRFRHDLHEVAQTIQEPKALKEGIKRLYQKHMVENLQLSAVDEDIQREYNRQREYLEKSVESLKRKLNKDQELHRTEGMRIMSENVSLIGEINLLRRDVRTLKAANRMNKPKKAGAPAPDYAREVEMQKAEIRRLRDALSQSGAQAPLDTTVQQRPTSRERLPPMEGMEPAQTM